MSTSEGTAAEAVRRGAADPEKLRYAIKTALSLTLAYLIPMAMGWPQAQTAAITVMLIAATGAVSDSLQKGVLRVFGTVAGAVIGLTLIAAFPQDRMLYLLAVSVVVTIVVYLYNAYQGDSTAFMLTAVVTLMVFNGGDAEGAFIYGVDRAFMTAFGVIVYTVVASLLWPVRVAENSREQAAGLLRGYAECFSVLAGAAAGGESAPDTLPGKLLADADSFRSHLAGVRKTADGVADYAAEWNSIEACLAELEETLLPAMRAAPDSTVSPSRYIDNHPALLANIQHMFRHGARTLAGGGHATPPVALAVEIDEERLRAAPHLVIAAVAARAELLEHLQHTLLRLQSAVDSLVHDRPGFRATAAPAGNPAFVWANLENLKTALRAFCTFWVATAIWIQFNPPGGFTFVTLCTILVPLVSFTPATPKLLAILLSVGFLFALPAYIFLLPQLSHWLQLGAFLFAYAFVGFLVFPAPVSLFFLLGLFTLGIQNSMSYHVDVILLVMLMFYMVCAVLALTMQVPFTSRPGPLYARVQRRFFAHCATLARYTRDRRLAARWRRALSEGAGSALLARMQFFGSQVDEDLAGAGGAEKIAALHNAAEVLHGQLQIALRREPEFAGNPLVAAARRQQGPPPAARLCRALSTGDSHRFKALREEFAGLEQRLDTFLGQQQHRGHTRHVIATFYVYLALQASILRSLDSCHQAQRAIDWNTLTAPAF